MDGLSPETREQLEYEPKAYKNIKKNQEQLVHEYQRHIDLIIGAGMGLALGIVGNLFVQSYSVE